MTEQRHSDAGLPLLSPSSINFRAFDTSNSVLATVAPATLERMVDLCRHLEGLLSRFIEGSDIWRINHSQGRPVEVSTHTVAVLSCAEQVRFLSHGAFNIAVGQATRLWRPSSKVLGPPSISETNRIAKELAGFRITIDGLQVRVSPGCEIDLGGIAKGYICDQATDFLREQGAASALLNFGGNVVAIGQHPQGRPWKVGLQTPGSEREQHIFATLEASDTAIVTSGIYERGLAVEDRFYHHILNPRTCRPSESELVSVSVIAKDSMLADALATAILVLGNEDGMALATRFNAGLVLLQNNGTLSSSQGLALEPVSATNVNVALPIT